MPPVSTHTQNSWEQLYRGIKYATQQVLAGLVAPEAIQQDHPDPAAITPGSAPYVVLFLGPQIKQSLGLAGGGGRTVSYPTAPGAATRVVLTDRGSYQRGCTFIIYTFGFTRRSVAGRVATRLLTHIPQTTTILLPDDEESASSAWTPAQSQARVRATLTPLGAPAQVANDETRLLTQTQVPYRVQYSEYFAETEVLTTAVAVTAIIGPRVVPADPFAL